MNVKIEESWRQILEDDFEKPSFQKLREFLIQEKQLYPIYPRGSQIFEAFKYTPFDKVKVVILGQDPYHGPGQAHGLCFSVPQGIPSPPSLKNIFKELNNDLGLPVPAHGDLSSWAKQGVLLLNATLTVRANQAGSHQNKGWENFTDSIIQHLSNKKSNLVFLLWGAYAQKKSSLINADKHLILKSVHPSPLSAHRGFFGNKHFSTTNKYLLQNKKSIINWNIK